MFKNSRIHGRAGWYFFLILTILIGLLRAFVQTGDAHNDPHSEMGEPDSQSVQEQQPSWAFEETFDGAPNAPSQQILPRSMNYVITHRSHPQEHFTKQFGPYPADHADDCAGPNPEVVPLPQHEIISSHASSNSNPDDSFFICHNHLMTAIGEVSPYSVSAFWPRQEFDFSDGGVVEFDVNLNRGFTFRHWFEVMIVPRDQIRLGAGPEDSPIDEAYPSDRIVFEYRRATRGIKVGTGDIDPNGWIVNERDMGPYDFNYWYALYPDDPAVNDRRIRRTMRLELQGEQIHWGIEKEDGSFDTYTVDVPGGVPFDRGIVMFKTHNYTPSKDQNFDTFTFHWDNVRFDGPVVGRHDAYDADDVVYLQANGDRQIGESETVTINLPSVGNNPILVGQVNQPKRGQVLLSINGRPDILVEPDRYTNGDCHSDNWNTFDIPIDPAWLQAGENSLKWTIGPRPDCVTGDYQWDGFSIKALQIQMDSDGSVAQPPQTPTNPPAEGFDMFSFLPWVNRP